MGFFNKILRIFKQRKYTTTKQKKAFESDLEKDVRKDVDERISKEMKIGSLIKKEERIKRIELEILLEIIQEDSSYYTKEEIDKIIFESS